MDLDLRTIVINSPRTLAFGAGCALRCAEDLGEHRRVFLVSVPSTARLAAPLVQEIVKRGSEVRFWDKIGSEPTIEMFLQALSAARDAKADAVIGLGGGSPLDVAKLVAAFIHGEQDIVQTFGIGKLPGRKTYLACIPTTSGTGSEVSPNSILLDEKERLKKGVVSPHLVPDAAYVDPTLTLSVPSAVTAATGMDALTHCIEAYANKLAHPMIDHYALEGIRRISRSLVHAVEDGKDLEARTDLALGSLYGGLCLGPVNTGAVHALAYPLGGEFHVAHGVSNAVLLPHVLEFNWSAAPERYAEVSRALGADADSGLEKIRELSRRSGIPATLSDLGVPNDAIERMARSAMTVTRLLDRNVRTVTFEDAVEIYRRAF